MSARPQPDRTPLSIVVVGASGDLARHKVIPALFTLFCRKLLPPHFQVLGFARSRHDDHSFRELLADTLTCRHKPPRNCRRLMQTFLSRCHYCRGAYDSRDAFLDLYAHMRRMEGGANGNRLFYMAVPPALFADVARAVGGAGLVHCAGPHWSRVIIEKPFGSDRDSSDRLVQEMRAVFNEDQTFRIDHYLGKEVIQNLLVLRFANTVFEPVWNRSHVAGVEIIWQEDAGLEGRGGYFDRYGIVRDVVQNHLFQMLALTAMEPPVRADDAAAVRAAKVRLLRDVTPVQPADILLGQYRGAMINGVQHAGYREEPLVAPGSNTPTYAALRMRIDNPRWRGVPFVVRAGKALNERKTEIRLHFRAPPADAFACAGTSLPANRLVIRVQPDEAIHLHVLNKVPGLTMELAPTPLDLRYADAFRHKDIPSAYECLLWEALRGDHSLFIGEDELAASWDILAPVLNAPANMLEPQFYDFGGTGPRAGLTPGVFEGGPADATADTG